MPAQANPAWRRRRWLPGAIAALVVIATAFGVWLFRNGTDGEQGPPGAELTPPPELAVHANEFREGVEALEAGQPPRAIELLSSFSFGTRPIEQYRLYYLANAHEVAGEIEGSRRTLAALWRLEPRLIHARAVASKLATLYADSGGNARAAEVWGALATREGDPEIAAEARSRYLEAKFHSGDVGAMILAATNMAIESPGTESATTAAAMLRSLRGLEADKPLPLTHQQQIRRLEALLTSARPKAALDESASIDPETVDDPLRPRLLLVRGEALSRLSRHEASNEALEQLFSSAYRFAIPALRISANNHRAIAKGIDSVTFKTVTERVRSGTRTVTRKGKKVKVPAYRTVRKRVEQVNPEKQREKDRHEALYVERLNDLRSLPIETGLRIEVLASLVDHMIAREQEGEIRRYVSELVELDPTRDPALQHFWDRGWAAWTKGNNEVARDLFNYIAATYRNPNIQRQATYWFARTIEREGHAAEGERIYRELASAPYQDLYALFSRIRLGDEEPPEPVAPAPRISWEEIAEAEVPGDLRLAYELNALGFRRVARLEVQKNLSAENRKWADAILGDLYFMEGNQDLAYRYMRRAWPELATPEQNAVPWRFLEMYYPLRYESLIREASEKNRLDPYLVMALIRQESAFNPDAKSWVGATGLMQIMPATGQELGDLAYGSFSTSRLTDPEVNVELGTRYLRRVIDLLDGNIELALAGYNGGPYRIRRWRQQNPSRPLDEFLEGMPLSETRGYVKRITLLRTSYEQLYGSRPDSSRASSPAN
ncbi:MAG: transglycosylase SLT domain-containing protein [Thermoanaerobaculia bacterium]